MAFTINGRLIDSKHPPYIVAELSANHNGSLERALKTIEMAKRCGADAVKIQTYTPDTMTIDCDSTDFIVKGGLWDGYSLYNLYRWAYTPYEWHQEIFDCAHKCGIAVFSTPFDESAVDLLESLQAPAYKISSFELVDLPLISFVAKTGKPIILSTGMASEQEIEDAIAAAYQSGCEDLIVLHCVSSYPASIDQVNLRKIPQLVERFGVSVGLSDHTLGTVASVAAVALGACIIEKHFTLSRAEKGPDSEFSLEPDELERLCRDTHDAWSSLGEQGFQRPLAESGNHLFRRSIYFVRDLPAGALVSYEDVRRIRPGFGLPPRYFDSVIGKRTKVSVTRGTPVSLDHFEL
jgi:pseudaminic acid synthase